MTLTSLRSSIETNRGKIVALAAAILALLGASNFVTDGVLFGAEIVGLECTQKEPNQ